MAYSVTHVEDEHMELEIPNLNHYDNRTSTGLSYNSNGTAKQKKKATSKNYQNTAKNGVSGGVGENRFDARFKVLLLGNSGVGKTSLIRSLIGEPFNAGTISTIGIDMAKKIFVVDDYRIQLEIWDTAGQEQYHSIVALHFREAKGFIVVYDITDRHSFEQIRKYWLSTIDQHMGEPVPVFFAANKADLSSNRTVTSQEGQEMASKQCAHGFFETSAKTKNGVTPLFQRVAEAMVSTWGAPKRLYEMNVNGDMESRWPNQAPFRNTVQLTLPTEKPPKVQCCLYQ